VRKFFPPDCSPDRAAKSFRRPFAVQIALEKDRPAYKSLGKLRKAFEKEMILVTDRAARGLRGIATKSSVVFWWRIHFGCRARLSRFEKATCRL